MQKILKISQQTFWQIVVKLVTTVSGFVILSIVSRNYGEAGTGDFTLALTYLAFFYIAADFGFNAEVLRRVRDQNSTEKNIEFRKLLGTRIFWSFGLMVLASLILIILPTSFSLSFKLATLFGLLIILCYSINQTAQAIFQDYHRYDLDIPATAIGVIAGTGLIYLLGMVNSPVYLLVLGYLLAWLIHSFLSTALAVRLVQSLLPIFSLTYTKSLIRNSWPIAGTLVLNTVYFRADAFLLSYFDSTAVVGVYNLAYQFFQAILVLPTFAMNAFYPLMLETFKTELARFKSQLKLAGLILLAGSLLTTLLTFLLSPFLIKIITKSGFSGSIPSLQILSLGFPAYFLSALLMWAMITKKMYKSLLVTYFLGLLFNVAANLIFIPTNSIFAASWITGISEYLILTLQIVILWKR